MLDEPLTKIVKGENQNYDVSCIENMSEINSSQEMSDEKYEPTNHICQSPKQSCQSTTESAIDEIICLNSNDTAIQSDIAPYQQKK